MYRLIKSWVQRDLDGFRGFVCGYLWCKGISGVGFAVADRFGSHGLSRIY